MAFWMYNADGGKLFEDGEEAPKGYFDCPTKSENKEEAPTKEELHKILDDAGIKYQANLGIKKLMILVEEHNKTQDGE